MSWARDFGYGHLLVSQVVAFNAGAFRTAIAPIWTYRDIFLFHDATIAFTGGTTPGLRFTLEVDCTGGGEWIAASTLIATANGFTAAAPVDPTITATGKAYRYYREMPGLQARVMVEVTGAPTGGTATVERVSLSGKV